MHPNTGHLVRILKDVDLPSLLEAGYQEVPPELEEEVERELGQQNKTYVNLHEPSPLSQWAADHRQRKKKEKTRARRRRKEAKQRSQRLRRRTK